MDEDRKAEVAESEQESQCEQEIKRQTSLVKIPKTRRDPLDPASAAVTSTEAEGADDLLAERPASATVSRLGRSFSNGKPLSDEMRLKIVQLAQQGQRPSEISKKLLVSVACACKIIKEFNQTGTHKRRWPGRSKPHYIQIQEQLQAMRRDKTRADCKCMRVDNTSASAGIGAGTCCEESEESLQRIVTSKRSNKGVAKCPNLEAWTAGAPQLPVCTQQATRKLNQSNKTATRRRATTAAISIKETDILVQETSGSRHCQQITNQTDFHHGKRQFQTTEAPKLPDNTEQATPELNHLNEMAKRRRLTTAANNIEEADILVQGTAGCRHYQQITNQIDFHHGKRQVHIPIIDECSTDGSGRGDLDQVELHHHHLNTIEDGNQLSPDTPYEEDGESFYSSSNHSGNDSDSFNLDDNNNGQDSSAKKIGWHVQERPNLLSRHDAQPFDLTVSRPKHSSPTVSNLVSPSLLSTQVNTTKPGNDGRMERSCRCDACPLSERKIETEILLLNGKQYEILRLGEGVWISKNEYEMMKAFRYV